MVYRVHAVGNNVVARRSRQRNARDKYIFIDAEQ